MLNRTSTRNRVSPLFNKPKQIDPLTALHRWLLILGSVMIFILLPLLFVLSSLDTIHMQIDVTKIEAHPSLSQDKISQDGEPLEVNEL